MAAYLAKVSGLYDCVTLALSWGVGVISPHLNTWQHF